VVVVGGSRANGFPTTTDRLLINVASNQVATVLETVALQISERELQAKAQSQQRLLETVLKQLPCGVIIANPPRGEILLILSMGKAKYGQFRPEFQEGPNEKKAQSDCAQKVSIFAN